MCKISGSQQPPRLLHDQRHQRLAMCGPPIGAERHPPSYEAPASLSGSFTWPLVTSRSSLAWQGVRTFQPPGRSSISGRAGSPGTWLVKPQASSLCPSPHGTCTGVRGSRTALSGHPCWWPEGAHPGLPTAPTFSRVADVGLSVPKCWCMSYWEDPRHSVVNINW